MPDMSPIREDLQATLDARRDLGPEYEAALVESLAERIDATIAARVHAELAAQSVTAHQQKRHKQKSNATMIPIALGSLGISIPLTAIAVSNSGLVGLMVTWAAIIVINVAAAATIMRRP